MIDEFNRAQIDRAFGDLFTAIESLRLKVLTDNPVPVDRYISPDFRIIATLNTADLHFLFEMSDALKRRFAYVYLPVPSWRDEQQEKDKVAERILQKVNLTHAQDVVNSAEFQEVVNAYWVFISFARQLRDIGTAQAISTLTYVVVQACNEWNSGSPPSLDSYRRALSEGINAHVIPQLDTMPSEEIVLLARFLAMKSGDRSSAEAFVGTFFEPSDNGIVIRGVLKAAARKLATYWKDRFGEDAPTWMGIETDSIKPVSIDSREKLVSFVAEIPSQPAATAPAAPTTPQQAAPQP